MTKRRKMIKFRLDEISGVDNPAQEGARVVLMKRDAAAGQMTREEMRRVAKALALTTDVDGHAHMLDLAEAEGGSTSYDTATGDEYGHSHHWIRNLDGTITIGAAAGHTHGLLAQKRDDTMDETKLADMAKRLETLEAGLAKSTADLGTAQAVIALTQESRAHYDTLPAVDQAAWLKKSAADQAAELAAVAKNHASTNPVIFKSMDGTEYRENDDPRLVKMAKDRDADRRELAKSRDEAITQRLEKRAGDELAHYPGDSVVKVALLRAVDGIEDADIRKRVTETLTAGDRALKADFAKRGTSAGTPDDGDGAPEARLEKLAKRHAETAKVSLEKARVDVLTTPEGIALYDEIEGRRGASVIQ